MFDLRIAAQSRLVFVMAVAVLAGACQDPTPKIYQRHRRLVSGKPEILYSPVAISSVETIFRWSFAEGQIPSTCSIVGAEAIGPSPEGLRIRATEARSSIHCEIEGIESQEIDLIEVQIRGLRAEPIDLGWVRAGIPPVAADRLVLDQWSRSGSEGTVFRFDLAEQPSWDTEIDQIEVGFRTRIGKILTLGSIDAQRSSLDPELLSEALSREWLVAIDHQWQEALLTTDSFPIVRSIEIAEESQLRFSFGLTAEPMTPVTFSVRLIPRQDRLTSEFVFETSIGPDDWTADRTWRDAVVDLNASEDFEGTIELSSSTGQPEPGSLSLGAWGSPEIWSMRPSRDVPNVIIVLLDTLRADHLSAYGYGRATSPNIDRWAAGGALFTTAVTQSPWTLPAHVSLFSSVEAFRHGMNFPTQGTISRDLPLLAEILRRSGYATRAVTGGGFVHPRYGFVRGFDSYSYWPSSKDRSAELETGVDRSIAWLESMENHEPFFLFLHTFDVHAPYLPRSPFFEEFHGSETASRVQTEIVAPTRKNGFLGKHRAVLVDGSERVGTPGDLAGLAVDLYDSGIASADRQLERLFEYLARTGLDDRSLVVLTSDHGEALGEDGTWAHGHLDDSNLLIPLAMTLPGSIKPNTTVDRQVRLIDIAPTILDLVGISIPSDMDGRSLVPLLDGRVPDHPAPAWSYAASTNEGLALRWADEVKFVFRDSVWAPLSGEQLMVELRTAEGESAGATPHRDVEERLRAVATKTLDSNLSGLRIEFANQSDRRIEGTLHSGIVEPVTVKSAGVRRPSVLWQGMGQMGFELDSRDTYTLIFLKQPLPRVDVSGEISIESCPGSLKFEFVLEDPQAEGVHAIEVDPIRCAVRGLTEGRTETGLNIRWQGEVVEETSSSDRPEIELRKQLEALGYIGE